MIGALTYSQDKKGFTEPLSAYEPPNAVVELTRQVKIAYQNGKEIQDYPFAEFNNRSFLERMDDDQRAWLSWNPDPYEGEEDWRFNGVRPITRNRVISTAAHLTAQLLVPAIFAQNQFSEEDRGAAYVVRDMVEYNIKHSNYETAFLFGVIGGLVNPVSYFKVDYVEGIQHIWNETGSYVEVADDILSGFQHSLIPPEDILISNAYQYDIQKQDCIIEKSYISKGEAEGEYGLMPYFKYVQEGKKVLLGDDGRFYEVEDVNNDLIEKVVYKHRRSDCEVVFLGGVYMGDSNPDYNPFVHRTNKNKPKYNVAKFGYEPIDTMRFYFYKSLVAKMANDQESADRQWQMYFDASLMATFPPTVTMGAGKLDRSVMTPATNTDLDTSAKIQPLNIANPSVALSALYEAERSITESSQDPQAAGIRQGPQKTKGESVILEENKETQLGLASKMIASAVKQVGELIVDDTLRYQTVGQLSEITGDMTYRTFLLDNKIKGGRTKTTKIKFTDRFAGREMTKEQKNAEEYRLMEEAGEDMEIFEANPGLVAGLDYLITIDADRMLNKNDRFIKAFKLEVYDRGIQNPLIANDPEAMNKLTRDFLFEPMLGGEAANYLPKIQQVASSLVPPATGGGQDLPSRMVRGAAMEGLSGNK